jgi:methylphosphotriester-DNA--protein-cysteine methyltransferase
MASKLSETEAASNVGPEAIKAALADYVEDKGVLDRAGMKLARNQAKHEKLGVDAALIRMLYREDKLTPQERAAKFAMERRYRRAMFTQEADGQLAMDFAAVAEKPGMTPAEYEQDQRIRVARAYNDAWNTYKHAGKTAMNPHIGGTEEHAAFARGLADAQEEGIQPVQRGRPPNTKPEAAAVVEAVAAEVASEPTITAQSELYDDIEFADEKPLVVESKPKRGRPRKDASAAMN